MGQFGLSQPVPRLEDPRLLRGEGCFGEDRRPEGLVHGAVLRSPHAHARVVRLETTPARALPGVLAVVTAADLAAAGVRPIAVETIPAIKPGTAFHPAPQPALAAGRVRFCGEAIAFVVAETPERARDALEAIEVDYEPLGALTDARAAAAPGAPAVWDEVADNVAFVHAAGHPADAVAGALQRAERVLELELLDNRVAQSPIETRTALGWVADGRLVLSTGTQMPNALKGQIARAFEVAPERVRVLVEDVGGGFGGKNSLYPEQILVLHAARLLGRPVRWAADRSESFLADFHGRDQAARIELGLDAGHRIVALRMRTFTNLGAYLASRGAVMPALAALMSSNVYRIPALHVEAAALYSHTVPTDPYRGAGRPEMTYFVERMMDAAASRLGVDRIELRRRNLVPPEDFPYATPTGLVYDPCDFAHIMDAALEEAGWAGFPARREASRARGRLRGIGASTYVERCGGGAGLGETAVLEVDAAGRVTLLIGTMANGQGHRTAYAQILNERLGVPLEAIDVVQGDTDRVATGTGTGGSWSMTMGGVAAARAADRLVERLRAEAAEALEAAAADVEFADGAYRVRGTDLSTPFLDVAAGSAAAERSVIAETDRFEPENYTFPYGCHVCEVEVDPETGAVRVEAYTAVHDFGRALNPLLLAGQVHGGVVQGIGQALLEHVVYDEAGQLLSGSLMDYCLPRADDLPPLAFTPWQSPALANPLDVKGCGEAGATGSPPAVMNAIADAIGEPGASRLDMPATPERVWRALAGR